jgi:colanic acid/amylovoran biosynthesis glycosyltransferase
VKIAYFVDGFPLVSETFVLAQIAGMIRCGHDVTIFANKVVDPGVRHPVLEKYKLMDKVVIRPTVRRNWLRRLGQGVRTLVAAAAAGHLATALATVNMFRLGTAALGMNLLIRASAHFGHEDFDVLHCQFGQLGVEVADLRRCGVLKGTLITSFRGADATRAASKKPERFQTLFATGDQFLAVSVSIRDLLVDLGCPAKKIAVLRSGVDLSKFSYREPRQLNAPVRLVTIGRLGPTKGHEYALDAVRDLIDSGLSVEYRIVGDGKRLNELSEYAAERDLDSVVTFDGAVNSDAVVQILRDTDVLIAPSIVAPTGQTEGVPNVLKEAMASGVPVVGTMVGGVAELIDHGRNGFLVPQKDAGAIADCIRTIIAHQDEMPQMLSRARQSIEQDYDLGRLNRDLEDVYVREGGSTDVG